MRTELRITTDDASTTKAAYDALYAGLRHETENALGEQVEWELRDGTKTARIALYFPDEIGIDHEERWPELRDWMVWALGKLRATFDPALERLSAPAPPEKRDIEVRA